ncbi:hypothetical protein EV356DRAFT_508101 [Viridothelium virens]|uniref:Uncharacterized protein n=1 Tax=Viridothelium virens TaxID=1048519 RepID=A0A6A6GYV7_VIRVR|nr:hypothetical protein EV356DRAFT_508101 [Viridothelium virens]
MLGKIKPCNVLLHHPPGNHPSLYSRRHPPSDSNPLTPQSPLGSVRPIQRSPPPSSLVNAVTHPLSASKPALNLSPTPHHQSHPPLPPPYYARRTAHTNRANIRLGERSIRCYLQASIQGEPSKRRRD